MANKKDKYMNYSNCEIVRMNSRVTTAVFSFNSSIRNTSVQLLKNLDLLFNR